MIDHSPVGRATRLAARYCAPVLLAVGLAACGGGGGGGSTPTPSGNTPPVLTGNLTPAFPENSTVSFFLSVDDADGDTVTITVGTSADGQFFTLDTGSGEVRSTQAFDFEAPQDANGDNVYEQTVTLNDGTTTVTRTVRVTILNEEEPPTCVAVPNTSVDENATGLIATLAGTDPDAGDEAIAVFENLMVDDFQLDGFLSIDAATGEVSLDTPLDAEAFDPGYSFIVSANYRTNSLFDRCEVTVALNDLPTRVTSGILITENRKQTQLLGDLDGGGVADFWLPGAPDPSGSGPLTGTLVFGETLADALLPDGAATVDVATLGIGEAISFSATFPTGFGNATSAILRMISDLDGDGSEDLLFMSQPPNDGLDPTRRPWGYVVFAQAIATNASGTIDLDALPPGDGFSLTGPVDFNGGNAGYAAADVDGVAGDELIIALPEAIGTGSEQGLLLVVDNAALANASGNLDFDQVASTRAFTGAVGVDELATIGAATVVGDLSGDGINDLVLRSLQAVTVIPSANLLANTEGDITVLNPLVLDLGGQFTGAIDTANVDNDGVDDLLIVRGQGDAGSEQASVLFGAALPPLVASGSTVALDDTNFNAGEYIAVTSSGSGDVANPVTLTRVGDLDGDGRDEVAFGLNISPGDEPGAIYIVRGSTLAGLTTTGFDIDAFTAADGLRIPPVPFQFNSLTTKATLAPDVDGDGLPELYVTSNQNLQVDPAGLAVIILSTDIVDALANDQPELDMVDLFFNETSVGN